MLGNILIDKFNCYFPLNLDIREKAIDIKKHVEDVLGKHFASNAYNVSISKEQARFSFWFTPTRYFDDIEDKINYTDTNLDMPEEQKFLNLFEEILSNKYLAELLPYCKITKLDLTKNFLMKKKPYYYLEKLLKRRYPNRYKAISCSSGYYAKTVSVTALANKLEKQDTTGDRELKFYDKTEELKAKHITEVILKNPLAKEESDIPEIKMNYIKATNTLKLDSLNILRAEWQFQGSRKLSTVSKHLGFEDAEDGLYLKDFLELMGNGKLYKSLDNFYMEFTLEVLKPKNIKKESRLNIYNQILCEYFDIAQDLPIHGVFRTHGLENKYIANLKKIQSLKEDSLIKEVVDKITSSQQA